MTSRHDGSATLLPFFGSKLIRPSVLFLFFTTIVILMIGIQARTAVRRQIMHYDEAYYLLEGLGISDTIRALPSLIVHPSRLAGVKRTLRKKGDIIPPGNCKPSYALILGLFLLLPVKSVYAANFLGIIGALLGLGIFYACAKTVGNNPVQSAGLTTLFYVSPIWNYYTVSGFSNTLAAVMELLAVFYFLRERSRLAALWLGIAFTVHYGHFPLTGLLMAFMVFDKFQKREWKRLAEVTCLFFAPLILWQFIYLVGRHLLQSNLTDVVYRTYAEQILYNFHRVSPSSHAAYWDTALKRNLLDLVGFIKTEGILLSILLFGGSVGAWKLWPRLRPLEKKLLAAVTLTALLWLFNPGVVVSRAIAFLLPFLYWSLALFFGRYPFGENGSARIRGGLFCGLLVLAFVRATQLELLLKTPFSATTDYLKSQGYTGQIVGASDWPIWQVYMGTRMEGRPERIPDVAHLKTFITESAAASITGRAPLIIIDGSPYGYDAAFENYYEQLYRKGPDWRVPLSYTSLDIFRHEISSYLFLKNGPDQGTLALYWVTPS